MTTSKTVLITGCSEGSLGDALARAFHERDFHVFATARDPKKIAHFKDLGIQTIVLDVQSQKSIEAAAQDVSRTTDGKLDILINNSGKAYMMPLADVELSKVEDLFDVNVFSSIRVIQAFLPLVRKAAPGSVIANNSSMASILGLPTMGTYSASKAALSVMTDCLRGELAPFEIKVVELKTGSVKSQIFTNQAHNDSSDRRVRLPPNSIYDLVREKVEDVMNGQGVSEDSIDADIWAKQVVGDLTRSNPPARAWRGAGVWMAWFVRGFLPHTAPDGQFAKVTGMDVLAERLRSQK